MFFIGITGGVGAGKSEVLRHLEMNYDAFCLRSDELAHQMMKKGAILYAPVLHLFGESILDPEGNFHSGKIAAMLFKDPEKLRQMNQLVHPAVRREILRLVDRERERGRAFFFLESALLIEEKYNEICDELWYVYANEKTRRGRLSVTRGYSPEKTESIMKNQKSEAVFRSYADFVIDNNGSPEDLQEQLDEKMKSMLTLPVK